MERLFTFLFLVASFRAPAAVLTVGRGGNLHHPAIAFSLNGLSDTKVDSNKDNYADTWIIKSKKQMQVHFLNKQGIYKSIFYYNLKSKLLRVDVDITNGKSLSKIYLIPNPKMNLAEEVENTSDAITCDNHTDGLDNIKSVSTKLVGESIADSATVGNCSILKQGSKEKVRKIIGSIINSENQKCQVESLNKYLPNSDKASPAITAVAAEFNRDRDLPEDGLFQCFSDIDETLSSKTVPDKIKLKVSNGFIDSGVNEVGLRHEYMHLVIRNACLISGNSICSAVSTDEQLIKKINDDVQICLSGSAKVGGVAESAATHIGVMSEVVTEPLGAPLATLQLESAQVQPVSVGQINTLAYLPAAEVLAKDPAVLERKTLALAQPMLERGERIYRDVRNALGSELDVLPAAGASDLRMASASKSVPDAVGKFDKRLADIASKREAPAIKPVADRGSSELSAASAVGNGKLTQSPPEIASNKLDQAEGATKEKILAGDKASAGSLAAAATGASSSPGMAVRQGGGKGGNLQAQAPMDRNPAAVDASQLNPETVATQISSLPGREVLARLSDDKFYSKVAAAKIAIFDLDNEVRGANLSVAKDCYIIRSLDRKPTPINCTQKRKR